VSSSVCERCGREFDREEYRDVHPCPEIVGEKTAREIRAQFDPCQYHLVEFAGGN
jgi:CDP-diacylglycerol pyrophosphatase